MSEIIYSARFELAHIPIRRNNFEILHKNSRMKNKLDIINNYEKINKCFDLKNPKRAIADLTFLNIKKINNNTLDQLFQKALYLPDLMIENKLIYITTPEFRGRLLKKYLEIHIELEEEIKKIEHFLDLEKIDCTQKIIHGTIIYFKQQEMMKEYLKLVQTKIKNASSYTLEQSQIRIPHSINFTDFKNISELESMIRRASIWSIE